MILHISVQFPFHMATWFVALGRHRGFLASDLICWSHWERKWTLSSKSRTECLQEKFWPFFNVFPSGLFPSGRPSLISWLFTESRDAWGLLEEKQTSIENICCRKFSTSLTPPSPHHCVSPSWSLKVCVDWRGWTSKLEEAEVTSTMSLQGLVTS